ncbi:MAG: hypothetical protein KGL68_18610 [Burkholderiales bacterium]|nr:hypothetical protein [Burkholderiales bacterium]
MKIARVLLLVLLSALLPIRGAMAAALPCAGAAGATSGMHQMHEMQASHGGHHDEAGADAHMVGKMSHGQHHHEGAAGQGTCNLCSACCSVPPLASAVPGVPLPHAVASVAFPDLTFPAPSFLSEGQERPPRSI